MNPAPAEKLATKIADNILKIIKITRRGQRGMKCHRIALMSGTYPDHERNEGGLCRSSLIGRIRDVLVEEL